ncbi:DUF2771 domain-containing protein [Streptomyces sp. AJS327]|nr:DUF2771 domain-containing protein [Streptomyces sp. AJS327]
MRTATAVGAVSLGLLALSACDKPTPVSTVTVGSDSASVEAACYDDGGTVLTLSKSKESQQELRDCLEKDGGKLTASTTDKVRVGVEPGTADSGWLLFVDGAPLEAPTKKSYRSFDAKELLERTDPTSGQSLPKKEATISVVQADGTKIEGVWNVTLKNDDA